MSSIKTYNNIIAIWENIANRHKQIQDFYIGDVWEIDSNTRSYPLLTVNPNAALLEKGENRNYAAFDMTFTVRVMDLVFKGEENEKHVLSDTLDMMRWIVTEFNQHPYYINSDFQLVDDLNFQPFTEDGDDAVSGWEVEMKIRTPYSATFCEIPISEISGFEFSRPDCGTSGASGMCLCIKSLTADDPIIITENNGNYNWSLNESFTTAATSGQAGGGVFPYVFLTGTDDEAVPTWGLNSMDVVSPGSAILGGRINNITEAVDSVILGGFQNNNTKSFYSAILGGYDNILTSTKNESACAIFGWSNRMLESSFSSVLGGVSNTINATSYSFIGGGSLNNISAKHSFIGGGKNNEIKTNPYATIGGGQDNYTNSIFTTIAGGKRNKVTNIGASTATISGGLGNYISGNGDQCTIGGGSGNEIKGSGIAFIGGGSGNKIGYYGGNTGASNVIVGGKSNELYGGEYNFIGGGFQNFIYGYSGIRLNSIVGGARNKINASKYNSIGGGQDNEIGKANYSWYSNHCNILGGNLNKVGDNGNAYIKHSTIVGGASNKINSDYSTILGGKNNITSFSNTHIIGSNITADVIDTTFVENLSSS